MQKRLSQRQNEEQRERTRVSYTVVRRKLKERRATVRARRECTCLVFIGSPRRRGLGGQKGRGTDHEGGGRKEASTGLRSEEEAEASPEVKGRRDLAGSGPSFASTIYQPPVLGEPWLLPQPQTFVIPRGYRARSRPRAYHTYT